MRYIYYIIGIIVLFTGGLLLLNRLAPAGHQGEPALTVNGRVITVAELNNRQRYSAYPYSSMDEFVEELITRELLIEEARKRGIDREEPFRRAMQEQYEKSLIKQLTDRLLAEFDASVNDTEVAAWKACSRRHYQLQQQLFAGPEQTGRPLAEQQDDSDFIDLPTALQLHLLDLETGQASPPFPLDDHYCVLRVDKISSALSGSGTVPADEEIRTMLADARRQEALAGWLQELRRRATVTRNPKLTLAEGQR